MICGHIRNFFLIQWKQTTTTRICWSWSGVRSLRRPARNWRASRSMFTIAQQQQQQALWAGPRAKIITCSRFIYFCCVSPPDNNRSHMGDFSGISPATLRVKTRPPPGAAPHPGVNRMAPRKIRVVSPLRWSPTHVKLIGPICMGNYWSVACLKVPSPSEYKAMVLPRLGGVVRWFRKGVVVKLGTCRPSKMCKCVHTIPACKLWGKIILLSCFGP